MVLNKLNMKTYLTILFAIAAISVQAQTMIKIKSKSAIADSIWMPKYGQEIMNITANAQGDTVRSIDYLIHVTSDTTVTFPVQINYYDKNGTIMTTVSKQMPANVYLKWTALETKLYTWIFNNTRRLSKQN